MPRFKVTHHVLFHRDPPCIGQRMTIHASFYGDPTCFIQRLLAQHAAFYGCLTCFGLEITRAYATIALSIKSYDSHCCANIYSTLTMALKLYTPSSSFAWVDGKEPYNQRIHYMEPCDGSICFFLEHCNMILYQRHTPCLVLESSPTSIGLKVTHHSLYQIPNMLRFIE